MNTSKKSKVAIVTGASRGIGAAVAKRLSADGISVLVNFANNADSANAVVGAIKGKGGRATVIQADVSVPEQVVAMFDQATALYGGVDILVNNAGIMQPGLISLSDTDDALFDKIVAVNLKGTFNTLRLAAGKLRDNGRIVNFSSSVRKLATPGYTIYSATKSAVETLTNIFAKELRGRNITVNAVAPGPTATDLFLKNKTNEQIQHLAKMPPLERLGQPEDIANAVAFLVGVDAGWVNGQTIYVNGGIV
ncbi:SDR family oxidoreductase [Desulfobacter curvatus]|uniref:SDR family oxidoreductase n=1 Tax=Desulfobacter curvatus TaxID=2290 RepID=UPI00037DBB8B|nr:SDR family oxidoreductase [Desulfobacter curvatus]